VSFLKLFEDGVVLDSFVIQTPREDIFAAFEYYLTNVNKGLRPFIIFGHSQGAFLAKELATTFLSNPQYSKYNANLVAVYAIGMSVTASDVSINPALKFSQSQDDIGVIISYNSTFPVEAETGAFRNYGT
jgi:pimeloyl-ACP methyl ester carboxylesterase